MVCHLWISCGKTTALWGVFVVVNFYFPQLESRNWKKNIPRWLSQYQMCWRLHPWYWIYVDFVARSRYLKQGYVIASHSILRDAITYSCLRYLLLATKSSNRMKGPCHQQGSILLSATPQCWQIIEMEIYLMFLEMHSVRQRFTIQSAKPLTWWFSCHMLTATGKGPYWLQIYLVYDVEETDVFILLDSCPPCDQ